MQIGKHIWASLSWNGSESYKRVIEYHSIHGGGKLDDAFAEQHGWTDRLGVATLQIAEPMNACSFAAGLSSQETGVGAGFQAFHGQMGCIYLFEDVLNPGKIPLFVCNITIRDEKCILG